MKKFRLIFITLSLVAIYIPAVAQYKFAVIADEEGKVKTETVPYFKKDLLDAGSKEQSVSWPKAFYANQSFKSMRGVCIQDINNDGTDDILFTSNSTLYAYSGNGDLYWQAALLGTAIYPPSAADINNDGNIEIVQVTGGSPANGHIHVFNSNGNALLGWPVSFSNNWIICAPALADLNGDKQLEILVAERQTLGKLHVLKNDGTEFSDNFPVTLDGYPGVTPSVAFYHSPDNEDNVVVDSLIIMCSTKSIFAYDFNGNLIDGFPIANDNTSFSYQSPLICVRNLFPQTNEEINIVGATHGDLPEFYSINKNGEYSTANWPKPTADNSWTYSAPTAIGLQSEFDFYLMSQPGADGTNVYPTIHAFTPDGNYVSGFPFERVDGLEGFISAMYSTDQNQLYIFTGSNMKDEDGNGYIHAYSTNTDLSNFVEMPGFPILVRGFTFMNGINLGDVNGNGKLDLIALSYDLNFASNDSTYINVFELPEIDYNPAYCYGTYKGNNLRNGLTLPFEWITDDIDDLNKISFEAYPNPCSDFLKINGEGFFNVEITDISGKVISNYNDIENSCIFSVANYAKGMYFVKLSSNNKTHSLRVIKM